MSELELFLADNCDNVDTLSSLNSDSFLKSTNKLSNNQNFTTIVSENVCENISEKDSFIVSSRCCLDHISNNKSSSNNIINNNNMVFGSRNECDHHHMNSNFHSLEFGNNSATDEADIDVFLLDAQYPKSYHHDHNDNMKDIDVGLVNHQNDANHHQNQNRNQISLNSSIYLNNNFNNNNISTYSNSNNSLKKSEILDLNRKVVNPNVNVCFNDRINLMNDDNIMIDNDFIINTDNDKKEGYQLFDELQKAILNKENKFKMIHVVWLSLKFIEKFPEYIPIIGLFWIDEKTFLINSTIFGEFINKKPNTINRNFRSHRFEYKKSTNTIRNKAMNDSNKVLPDSIHWIVRWNDNFTKSTTEEEAMHWKFSEIIPKKARGAKNSARNGESDSNSTTTCCDTNNLNQNIQQQINIETPTSISSPMKMSPNERNFCENALMIGFGEQNQSIQRNEQTNDNTNFFLNFPCDDPFGDDFYILSQNTECTEFDGFELSSNDCSF